MFKASRSQCTSGLFRCFWLSHMQLKEKYFSQHLWLLRKISAILYRVSIHVTSKQFLKISSWRTRKCLWLFALPMGKHQETAAGQEASRGFWYTSGLVYKHVLLTVSIVHPSPFLWNICCTHSCLIYLSIMTFQCRGHLLSLNIVCKKVPHPYWVL